jgi:hypothetical protein
MQGFIILMRNMIKGTYIFYQNGKEICRSENVITKFGKRYLTNFIAGNNTNPFKDLAFGINSTTATENDTRLNFEFYRCPVILNSTDIQTSGSNTTYSVIYKTTIPQGVAGVISEVGLYPSTRTSLNNFDSKFITDFNSFLDWLSYNNNSPEVIENTISDIYAKIGTNLLKMSSNGTSTEEYVSNISLNLSGYSLKDSITLAYYKFDNNLDSIGIEFYHTDNDYYSVSITPPSGTGYKISEDITLADIFLNSTNAADASQIAKIGIVINPKSGMSTDVGLDGLRINDEDTFDPDFGIISRSVLGSPLLKLNGRSVDVEYKLDLSF